MTIIELKAVDQKLCTANEPVVASGDKKSTKIHVEFSAEWAGYAKTAVFFTSKAVDDVIEQVMTGDACEIPHEVIDVADNLFIGVRGVIASTGAVKTSTLVKYKIEEGAPTGKGTTVPPTADVYQQLLSKTTELDKRLSNLLNSMTEDGEVIDIRYGADGVTYETAGEAVREQFKKNNESIAENETEIKRSKRATATYIAVPESEYDSVDVRLKDTKVDTYKSTSAVAVGDFIGGLEFLYPESYGGEGNSGRYVFIQAVKKDSCIVLSSYYDFVADSNNQNLIITDSNYNVTKLVPLLELNDEGFCKIDEDGYIYVAAGYGEATSETKLFSIKTPKSGDNVYVIDSEAYTYGDDALQAILDGKQILVKVPNKNGGTLYSNFMPVLQYQLPNENNDYLTLFYLKDGIAENIMVAMVTGSFDGVFGEITMQLSKTYTECPLEVNSAK